MANLNRSALLIATLLVYIITAVCVKADKELLCLVCNAVAEEVESEIRKVKPGQKMQVGSFRMDANGNQLKSEIEYARSSIHLNDILDGFCERMDNYAEATYKDTHERTIIKLTGSSGGMHPDIGKVDFVQDGELNKKLKFYCETIVDEFEDNILSIFSTEQEDAANQLCAQAAGFCHLPDGDDFAADDDYDQDGGETSTVEKDEL